MNDPFVKTEMIPKRKKMLKIGHDFIMIGNQIVEAVHGKSDFPSRWTVEDIVRDYLHPDQEDDNG